MTIIDCKGDGLARGRAHGEEARDHVRSALARWGEVNGARSGVPVDRYVSEFLSSTDVVTTMRRQLPDLAAEIQGIAEGAAVAADHVVAYNLMDEQWAYDLTSPRGCSVLAVAAEPPMLLAQNMDLPEFMDGSQLILRLAGPDQPEALVLTAAGLVGLTGVNRAGIAVCVNSLLMLRNAPSGVPVAAVIRGVLRHARLQEAVSFVRGIPHASGQHYAVASPEGVVGLECCAADVVTSSTGPRLVHTNHPLVSTSIDPVALERSGHSNTHNRLGFLDSRVEAVAGLEDARQVLADRTTPICIVPTADSRAKTFGGVAFALADPPVADFCLGLPVEAPWRRVGWLT